LGQKTRRRWFRGGKVDPSRATGGRVNGGRTEVSTRMVTRIEGPRDRNVDQGRPRWPSRSVKPVRCSQFYRAPTKQSGQHPASGGKPLKTWPAEYDLCRKGRLAPGHPQRDHGIHHADRKTDRAAPLRTLAGAGPMAFLHRPRGAERSATPHRRGKQKG